jgi:drug/metabolite transporter (DMT)-like permease
VLIYELSSYLFIFGTIVFTVYGQLILKWRIKEYGSLPIDFIDKLIFLLKMFLDPFILSGFFAAFLAALCWMAAMTKLDLSHAYPFMSLSFVLVLVLSGLLLNEPLSSYKIIGLIIIVAGIVIGSQG